MRPKRDPSQPMGEVTFYCAPCYRTFKAAPRVEPCPEQEYHPWRYLAECPSCGQECGQAHWEHALLKAWAHATGPKTADGLAAAARNLEGHPTPEETARTRFNAMKHGLRARTATYFPAKPDQYPFCKGCEVDRWWCSQQAACTKQTELFMLHQAAFEQRDPKRLQGIYSDLHAAVIAVLQQILTTIVSDGVTLRTPSFKISEDGATYLAEYLDPESGEKRQILDITAHPLFRPLGELLSRANLSLSDLGMTTKVIEAEEEDLGRLAHEREEQESLGAFRRRQLAALEGLAALVKRANDKTASDPILLEHQSQSGGEA